jgi:hypothetical protein
MPQRSNSFQELVDSIQRLLAPKNAKITQSAMFDSPFGGHPREVDVLIEFLSDLDIPLKIAVEAKDHARPIDSTTVESYIGKYNNNGGIIVDKVVIVARKFSVTAKKRAESLGFTLCTVSDLSEALSGTFDTEPNEVGAWWLSNSPGGHGRRVTVKLYDKAGQLVPLEASISSRADKVRLGRAQDWAERLLEHSIGNVANSIFAHFAGDMLHVLVDVFLTDHKATLGKKSGRVDRLEFDFGKRLQIPPTVTKVVEYSPEGGIPKRIGQEIGSGLNNDVIITYEVTGEKHPQAIQVKVMDKNGRTATEKTFRAKIVF